MKDFSILVAASLLSADFARMAEGVAVAEGSGADWLHLDVMDGAFVPNLTFGPKMVSDLRKVTRLPLDVHLMVEHPERIVDAFLSAGADHVTFHIEAAIHAHRIVSGIKAHKRDAGLSIVPSTPVNTLEAMLDGLDLVLVMTVNPGFGGQALIPECLRKVERLAHLRTSHGYEYRIAVDGGVNRSTVASVRDAGADVLISGSAFFGADDPASEVVFFREGRPAGV